MVQGPAHTFPLLESVFLPGKHARGSTAAQVDKARLMQAKNFQNSALKRSPNETDIHSFSNPINPPDTA